MNTIALFDGLPDSIVGAILSLARQRTVKAGTLLCCQGDPAGSMFLLRNGRARFVRTAGDGHEVLMRLLGPGDCFGMASLLEPPGSYMGTAQTVGEARVYEWACDDFRTAGLRHPRLSQNTLGVVLRYLKEYGDRHLALLSRTADQRLARTLTRLGATVGRLQPAGVEIDISNRDLGSLSDVGMYTVSRQLKLWEREGHVVKQRNRVVVRRPEALVHE